MYPQEEFVNDVPMFDVKYYFGWRSEMKAYLKKFGVWEIVINPPNLSNKKDKASAQKDAKKDNTTALKFLMDGLPRSVNECIGECTSAKDLWFKLEDEYKKERQDTKQDNQEVEMKTTKDAKHEDSDSNKGMDNFDCSMPIFDEVENAITENDEAMLKAKQRIINYVCNIDLRADWYLNKVDLNQSDYKMFRMTTFDYMGNLQKKNVEIKEFLKKLKHEGLVWLKLLKENEEEK